MHHVQKEEWPSPLLTLCDCLGVRSYVFCLVFPGMVQWIFGQLASRVYPLAVAPCTDRWTRFGCLLLSLAPLTRRQRNTDKVNFPVEPDSSLSLLIATGPCCQHTPTTSQSLTHRPRLSGRERAERGRADGESRAERLDTSSRNKNNWGRGAA